MRDVDMAVFFSEFVRDRMRQQSNSLAGKATLIVECGPSAFDLVNPSHDHASLADKDLKVDNMLMHGKKVVIYF